jgi:hypothetical protein
MDNIKLAEDLSKHIPGFCGRDNLDCNLCTFEHCNKESFRNGALKMAEFKDKALKEFLLTHIDIPYTGGRGEDESPLAPDYIEWLEKRNEEANKMFEEYKRYEDKLSPRG